MYGRHRNGLGIDPATGGGTVIGADGKEYRIDPERDLQIGKNLEGANLAGVNLAGVRLERARMRGVDLTGADLRGADLQGANLTGATMPDGTIYSGRAPNPGYGHHHGYGRRR